ncbi:hypothetical protein JR316_0005302 [Psilocybe cubensis]|uniref:Uncharacterized protein n=2 Tax=Psilocybe cubensis TaxID=181762 RepID=A0ACB8H5B6_PSICU|nr:hypothetical protein JR316_0005302 [Psilocybe cubensis]KAH9483198.1 hypothetical protein JR316_0005302 [Psilocybe cubensis]
MALARLPFTLSLAWAAYTSATPPNPPPRPAELRVELDYSLKEVNLRAALARASLVLPALIEIIIVLSDLSSISPQPQRSNHLQVPEPLTNPHTASSHIYLTPSFLAFWTIAMTGAHLRKRCFTTMGAMFTFELAVRRDHKLITRGPYAVVRHPAYTTAVVVMGAGALCWSGPGAWPFAYAFDFERVSGDGSGTGTAAAAALLAWIALAACWVPTVWNAVALPGRARVEDKLLHEKFGKEWEVWAERVPCRFIPGIY